mmetsp:Transcript_28990/g.54374  ORF Transcript_28990/g.54374 Transcript_28990/m.54374 type:complete len:107 (+) Transcript_28990:124-444(+)
MPPDRGRSLPPHPKSGGKPRKAICGSVGFCLDERDRKGLHEDGGPAGLAGRGLATEADERNDFLRNSSEEASEHTVSRFPSASSEGLAVDHAFMADVTSGAGTACE